MLRRTVAVVVAMYLLAGCGAAGEANPEEIGPRGVDELVIPTPVPDPGDFVARVDNPWFPLAPGTVWTYDVAGSSVVRIEVRVEDRREVVAGVPCVVVHRTATDADGRVVRESDTYYAQDRSGNVWTFGERGIRGTPPRTWRAGVDGAEAGLAMAATPRVGDGYLQERAPGVAADRSTVLALDAERTVPAGTFAGMVLIEDTADDVVVRRSYAEGTGLVEASTMIGGTERAVLARVTTPSAG